MYTDNIVHFSYVTLLSFISVSGLYLSFSNIYFYFLFFLRAHARQMYPLSSYYYSAHKS